MNKDESNRFERDGYIILKNVIKKEDCDKLIKKGIKPILKKNKIYYCNKKIRGNKNGFLFSGENNKPLGRLDNWKPLFESNYLKNVISKLYGRENIKWKWDESLGWIHIRYPFLKKKYLRIRKTGWHIDGLNKFNKPNFDKGITILPILNNINKIGGGTLIFKGSHKIINYWIHKLQNRIGIWEYIKNKIMDEKDIIEINGAPGDILIMHPHLIHTWNNCYYKNGIRLTFNISITTLNKK